SARTSPQRPQPPRPRTARPTPEEPHAASRAPQPGLAAPRAPHYPGTPTTRHPPRQLDAEASPAPVLASPVTPTVPTAPASGARRLLRANNSATARPAFLRWSSWIRATCESLKI